MTAVVAQYEILCRHRRRLGRRARRDRGVPTAWERLFTASAPFLPRGMRQRNSGDKIHKLAEVVAAATADEMYWRLTSTWKQPARVLRDFVEPQTVLTDRSRWAALPDVTERMMYLDLVTYLPDDILVKVDRASMGVGLEAREPLLDHRLIEFAWRLPMSMKIRNGQGKWLLRKVLYRYVPQSLVDRPKMGFAVPIDAWLRGPLRSWAEDLLDERRLREDGFFDARRIRRLEQRFTRFEIEKMMREAGLTDITFSEEPPFWCAVGFRHPS